MPSQRTGFPPGPFQFKHTEDGARPDYANYRDQLELVFNECGLPEPLGQRHACFRSKLYLCRRSLNSGRRISRRNSWVHLSTSPSTFEALSRHE